MVFAAWLSESNKSKRSLESIKVFTVWLFLFKIVMLCFVGEVRECLLKTRISKRLLFIGKRRHGGDGLLASGVISHQ